MCFESIFYTKIHNKNVILEKKNVYSVTPKTTSSNSLNLLEIILVTLLNV